MSEHDRNQLQTLNLEEKLRAITEHWSPRVLTECNDYQLKLAKLQGEFVWHAHPDTDEVFFVVAGELTLEFRDRTAVLRPGELLVVPRNVEHKPVAHGECHILLLEPRGTVNTGDQPGERTAPNDIWL